MTLVVLNGVKGPSFGGFKQPQTRGHLQVPGIQYIYIQVMDRIESQI